MSLMRIAVIGALILGAVGLYFWLSSTPAEHVLAEDGPTALVSIQLPDQLSDKAIAGKRGFEAKCVQCHGENAVGQKGVAPPLVHKIYEPSHHGDESFQMAIANGVRGHHWPFGDMPKIDGLTRSDVDMITTYIRELQRANGIN